MFSGLMSAAPLFAGRLWSVLKPALSTAVDFLSSETGENLAKSAAQLGMNKVAKTLNKVSQAAKTLKGKRTSEVMDMDVMDSGNKLMPEDDDYEEFRKYQEMKKKKKTREIETLEDENMPEYLKEG